MATYIVPKVEDFTMNESIHPVLAFESDGEHYCLIYETDRIKRNPKGRTTSNGRLRDIKQQYSLPPVSDSEPTACTGTQSRTKKIMSGTQNAILVTSDLENHTMNETHDLMNGFSPNATVNKSPPVNRTKRLQEVLQQFTLRSSYVHQGSGESNFRKEKVISISSSRQQPSRLQEAYQQFTPQISPSTPFYPHPGFAHDYLFEESNVNYRSSGTTPPIRSSLLPVRRSNISLRRSRR